MGAAGRDFHNFNIFFRNKKYYEVIAFTAAQIPNIEKRIYPPELSGRLYPKGIPIGRVETVGKEGDRTNLYALIKPFVSFAKLEEVLCIPSQTKG